MLCRDLAQRIEQHRPDSDVAEIARLSLLVLNLANEGGELESEEGLENLLRDASLRLHAATDQHSAMTAELENLANSDPKQFDREQIWVLLRAIKVQSQILQMYMGGEVIDV